MFTKYKHHTDASGKLYFRCVIYIHTIISLIYLSKKHRLSNHFYLKKKKKKRNFVPAHMHYQQKQKPFSIIRERGMQIIS